MFFLQEFSAVLEKRGPVSDVFRRGKRCRKGLFPAAGRQKWHFWVAKVVQKGGKSRAVGAQVWDF